MLDAQQRPGSAATISAQIVKPPILVTGAPRSGSTWLGNVIALAPGCGYVHEPFNKSCPPGRCNARFREVFTYVTPETEAPYVQALADTIAWKYNLAAEVRTLRTPRDMARLARDFAYFEAKRRSGARTILKDPIALFSADWLANRFGARVVVGIRHPAAFVASLRAAGWGRVHFEYFGDQPLLMRDRLAPFAAEIAAATREMPDPIDGGALLWNILHHHIRMLRAEHPDWLFVRHEDLSRNPVPEFEAVFRQLDLDFSRDVRQNLTRYTSGGGALTRFSLFGNRRRTMRDSKANITSYRKRLTDAEFARIRTLTEPIASAFYTDADW